MQKQNPNQKPNKTTKPNKTEIKKNPINKSYYSLNI